MPDEWYWKHKRETLGPLSTETLADLVKKRRIFDGDEVRFVESDEWLSGRQLKGLFAGRDLGSSCAAAAALLARVRHPAVEDAADSAPNLTPQLQLPAVPSIVGHTLDLATAALGGIFAGVVSPLTKLLGRFGRPLVAATVFILLGWLVVRGIDFYGQENEQLLDQMTTSWDDLRLLRSAPSSQAELASFQAETRAWLEPAVNDLEARARRFPLQTQKWFEFERTNAQVRHELLQAAVALRQDLERESNATNQHSTFEAHISAARRMLDGAYIRPVPSGAP